jgi:hypothetical protein
MKRVWIGVFSSWLVVMGLIVFPGLVAAQQAGDKPSRSQIDRWKEWLPLVGVWEGTSEGKPGKGKVRLEVSLVLDARCP